MVSKVGQNTFKGDLLSVMLQSQSSIIPGVKQQIALAIKSERLAVPGLSAVEITPEAVPLQRLPDYSQIIYRSAIAFKLASGQQPILDLAHQMMTALPLKIELGCQHQAVNTLQLSLPPTSKVRKELKLTLNFQVEVVSPGWLDFRLMDDSLAAWLQNLISANSVKLANNPTKNTPDCFLVQYAHARCCSILALAHQQGLIILKDGQLMEPYPIPWLQDDSEATRMPKQLCLVHPAEKRLIARILDILEAKEKLEQRQALKFAIALSQAWEEFSKHCRIWGEVKTQTPKLAQARLGLVAVTQGLLRSLLQDDLGVSAPVEL
jgi:hypothetical protein